MIDRPHRRLHVPPVGTGASRKEWRIRLVVLSLLSLPWLASGVPAHAQQSDHDALADQAVTRLQEYIRINTVNPPGNESAAVEFFAAIFEAEGIAYETAESAPGRGNIWARIDGGDEPGLVLLHHSDVVPFDPAYWDVDAMAGELVDDHVVGRGALDTKGLGILHLQAFLALHRATQRSGVRPDRDVIFMATADEEAGGMFGAGWLVEQRPELFEGVGVVLNEGGGGELTTDGLEQFGIEVTQKVPVWLRLVATDEPGHGSTPRVTSAPTRLVRALERLRQHQFPARVIPPVATYFQGIAPQEQGEWRAWFSDPESAIQDAEFLLRLQVRNPYLHAITRNTCSITRLEASDKINVVPPTAAAEIDCRVLPDQDVDAFVATLSTVLNDPQIRIERIMAFTPAISSTDHPAYRVLVDVTREEFPDAVVLPAVQSGFTDSHFFRDLGIEAYGYAPILVPTADDGGVHGNNERLSAENLRRGTRMMIEIVHRIVGARDVS